MSIYVTENKLVQAMDETLAKAREEKGDSGQSLEEAKAYADGKVSELNAKLQDEQIGNLSAIKDLAEGDALTIDARPIFKVHDGGEAYESSLAFPKANASFEFPSDSGTLATQEWVNGTLMLEPAQISFGSLTAQGIGYEASEGNYASLGKAGNVPVVGAFLGDGSAFAYMSPGSMLLKDSGNVLAIGPYTESDWSGIRILGDETKLRIGSAGLSLGGPLDFDSNPKQPSIKISGNAINGQNRDTVGSFTLEYIPLANAEGDVVGGSGTLSLSLVKDEAAGYNSLTLVSSSSIPSFTGVLTGSFTNHPNDPGSNAMPIGCVNGNFATFSDIYAGSLEGGVNIFKANGVQTTKA